MKESSKPGLLKSLFGSRRRAPVRAKLPLYIPVAPRADRQLTLDTEGLIDGLLRHDYAPVTLFVEMARLLDKINPFVLDTEQRARANHILMSELNNALGAVFPRFIEQGSGVPETREQREAISHAVRAVELLSISYKLVFQQDYAELSGDIARRKRLATVTLRLMELIRLEQLLRAFRYQLLPSHVWRDCNQLFFAARSFADVRAAQTLRLRIFNSAMMSSRGLFPELGTIEQIYLSVQITGLLDVISWPTHLMYMVDRYLAELDPPLSARRDQELELADGQVIIYRNQGMPPRFSRSQDELGDTLEIDLRPLVEYAATDRRALHEGSAAALSESILYLGERERAPVLDLLLQKLSPQRRREPRQPVFETREARVYGGFESVYRFLRQFGAHRDQHSREEPWDMLATQPEIVAGDGARSRWIVANESDGGVQFRIHETQYAMPLHVGRLVAYILANGDSPKLGYITRLQRVGDREVEVAIARFREVATAVVVEVLDSADQHTLPALLIRDASGALQLLCDCKYDVKPGDRLAVIAEGHAHTGVVEQMQVNKPEFVVFRLQTAG